MFGTNEKRKHKTRGKKLTNILRWILLLPAVLGMIALVLFLTLTLERWFPEQARVHLRQIFWPTVPSLTALICVLTATIVAPDYKTQTAWVTFAVGALYYLLLLREIGSFSAPKDILYVVDILSPVIIGFITTLFIYKYLKRQR